MKTKPLPSSAFSMIAVFLFFLSAPFALAVTDLGQAPSFLSKTLLVKLTPQARANLKVEGDDVNPAATGLPSLDAICRDHDVRSFRSIVASGAPRDPAVPINAWGAADKDRLEL